MKTAQAPRAVCVCLCTYHTYVCVKVRVPFFLWFVVYFFFPFLFFLGTFVFRVLYNISYVDSTRDTVPAGGGAQVIRRYVWALQVDMYHLPMHVPTWTRECLDAELCAGRTISLVYDGGLNCRRLECALHRVLRHLPCGACNAPSWDSRSTPRRAQHIVEQISIVSSQRNIDTAYLVVAAREEDGLDTTD